MTLRRTPAGVRRRPERTGRSAPARRQARREQRRRRSLWGRVLVVLPLLALTLNACTGAADSGEDGKSAGETSREIVVASGRDVTGKNGIRQQLIDAWNRQEGDSGYHARLVELPGSADEQRSQLLGALQSGSARYDVINLDVTWVPEFAAAKLIRPLSDGAVENPGDIVPSVAGTAEWKGERYAVPFNSDVGLLYYRRDYLSASGAQRTDLSKGVTWDELRQIIDAMNRKRPGDYQAGWTTQLAGYEGRTVNAIEAFASAVKDFRLTDADGHYTGSARDLGEGVAELRRRTGSAYTLDNAVHSDETATLSDFADGRTAFLRHWPYAYGTLYQTFTEKQLGVAPLPGKAVLGGQNLAVTAASPQAAKAADLIRYLTDPDSERCLLDAGFAATRVSAYADDGPTCSRVRTSAAAPSVSPTGESTDHMPRDGAGRPKYARDILLPALRNAVQRPRTPLYGAFTQTFTTQLGALFGDRPPSDTALAEHLDAALRTTLPD
ncbi:extracellular solute-binding protein [Streptomyces sp. NBC_00820]|uniref:extracellular solute-binding protein n=1 Tax=Streptomyces sp. NBC_00820 TaxID=2975842 RepID=UPI002ED67D31|nr:extracellular solute-binding protein [Streptomyces sp. NBC_00820]